MSISVLFSPSPTTIQLVDLSEFQLDALLSGSIDTEVEVTDHPIETGAQISDHRRPKPLMLTLEGLVTDTPLPDASAQSVQQSSDGKTWFSASAAKPEAIGKALRTLQGLVDSSDLVTISTPKGIFFNLTLTKLSIPLDPKTGKAVKFSATFKQIRTVSTSTVQIKRSVRKPKLSIGHVTIKQTTPPPANSSWALQAAQSGVKAGVIPAGVVPQ